MSLNLSGEPCLVVGGGPIGLRKARGLLRAGARVTVVSPEFDRGFANLKVTRLRRAFRAGDVRGAFLVVSATNDRALNEMVYRSCRRRRILVNVVDQRDRCTFIAPAVLRRGPVTISISTDAECPGLAKALRVRLEELLPRSLGRVARSLGAMRRRILRTVPTAKDRGVLVNEQVTRVLFKKAKAR